MEAAALLHEVEAGVRRVSVDQMRHAADRLADAAQRADKLAVAMQREQRRLEQAARRGPPTPVEGTGWVGALDAHNALFKPLWQLRRQHTVSSILQEVAKNTTSIPLARARAALRERPALRSVCREILYLVLYAHNEADAMREDLRAGTGTQSILRKHFGDAIVGSAPAPFAPLIGALMAPGSAWCRRVETALARLVTGTGVEHDAAECTGSAESCPVARLVTPALEALCADEAPPPPSPPPLAPAPICIEGCVTQDITFDQYGSMEKHMRRARWAEERERCHERAAARAVARMSRTPPERTPHHGKRGPVGDPACDDARAPPEKRSRPAQAPPVPG